LRTLSTQSVNLRATENYIRMIL